MSAPVYPDAAGGAEKGAVYPPYDEVPHGQADVQQRSTLALQHLVPLVVVGLWPRRNIAPNEAATAATHALDDDVRRLLIQLRDHLLPRPTHHAGAVEAPVLPLAPHNRRNWDSRILEDNFELGVEWP